MIDLVDNGGMKGQSPPWTEVPGQCCGMSRSFCNTGLRVLDVPIIVWSNQQESWSEKLTVRIKNVFVYNISFSNLCN